MLEKKLAALERIYAVYDKFIKIRDMACEKHCSACCTTNVTMTTLEGIHIVRRLVACNQLDVINYVQNAAEKTRFLPQTTTNQLAALCSEGFEPLVESISTPEDACLLLSENQCPLYELRPFGCRCLVSSRRCDQLGYAEVDEFTLSVNTVFLQIIEHLDCPGCTGNMVDVLQTLATENKREAYCSDALHCSSNRLIPNHPMKVLMIPPQHRTRMEPILQELRQIKI